MGIGSIGHKVFAAGCSVVGLGYQRMARGAIVTKKSLNLDVQQREIQRIHYECHLRQALDAHGIDLVIDVGANEGQFGSMLRSMGYMGRIVSFEPVPNTASALQASTSADSNWHVVDVALGKEPGELELNTVGRSTLSSALEFSKLGNELFPQGEEKFEAKRVPVHRLDQFMASRPEWFTGKRWFLKTDTQGFDLKVLQGCNLNTMPICLVQCELAVMPLYEGADGYVAVVDWLNSHGYVPQGFWPTFYHGNDLRIVEMDCLMARDA